MKRTLPYLLLPAFVALLEYHTIQFWTVSVTGAPWPGWFTPAFWAAWHAWGWSVGLELAGIWCWLHSRRNGAYALAGAVVTTALCVAALLNVTAPLQKDTAYLAELQAQRNRAAHAADTAQQIVAANKPYSRLVDIQRTAESRAGKLDAEILAALKPAGNGTLLGAGDSAGTRELRYWLLAGSVILGNLFLAAFARAIGEGGERSKEGEDGKATDVDAQLVFRAKRERWQPFRRKYGLFHKRIAEVPDREPRATSDSMDRDSGAQRNSANHQVGAPDPGDRSGTQMNPSAGPDPLSAAVLPPSLAPLSGPGEARKPKVEWDYRQPLLPGCRSVDDQGKIYVWDGAIWEPAMGGASARFMEELREREEALIERAGAAVLLRQPPRFISPEANHGRPAQSGGKERLADAAGTGESGGTTVPGAPGGASGEGRETADAQGETRFALQGESGETGMGAPEPPEASEPPEPQEPEATRRVRAARARIEALWPMENQQLRAGYLGVSERDMSLLMNHERLVEQKKGARHTKVISENVLARIETALAAKGAGAGAGAGSRQSKLQPIEPV